MISNRLLLRAATVLALTRGGVGPYPTMAGEGVFDTKLKPVTDLAQESMTPIALVYTDADKRTNLETGGTRVNWKRNVTVIIELAIGSVKPGDVGKPNVIKYLETDPEIEAMLDLFELETEMALFAIDNPYALAWRGMVKCIEEWESTPYRSAEQAARYAVRQIAITVELKADCVWQQATTGAVTEVQRPYLPVPYLSDLEDAIVANPEVFSSTLALLKGASSQVRLPELKHIHIEQDYGGGNKVITDIK